MSASITEAHRKLAYELMQMDDRLSAFAHRTAAQLIANSEARAVAAAVTALTFTHHQLRAQNDQFSDNLSAVGAAYNAEKARAERAEAELATERARLDYLLQWDVTFHDRADIDAELSYGQRKKSTPTLP